MRLIDSKKEETSRRLLPLVNLSGLQYHRYTTRSAAQALLALLSAAHRKEVSENRQSPKKALGHA